MNEKYEIIKKYMIDNNSSIRATAKHFGITKTIPEKISKELKNRKKKYLLDINIFENIDTEEKAYWLGFLYADGCINAKNGSFTNLNLELALKASDVKHLEKFQKFCKTDYLISSKTVTLKSTGKSYEASRITIYNTEFCNHLIANGCVPKKSLILKYPNLSKELNKHFIRGYFDGDGYLGLVNDSVEAEILGTEDMLNNIYNVLVKECGYSGVKRIYQVKNIFRLKFSKNKAKLFLNYIYKNSSIYLDRKYNLYLDLCSE